MPLLNDITFTRTIKLTTNNSELLQWLEQLPAIKSMQLDNKKLTIIYDVSQFQWPILQRLLMRHNVLAKNISNTVKHIWYAHADNSAWKKHKEGSVIDCNKVPNFKP
jgi:hypothetical protein